MKFNMKAFLTLYGVSSLPRFSSAAKSLRGGGEQDTRNLQGWTRCSTHNDCSDDQYCAPINYCWSKVGGGVSCGSDHDICLSGVCGTDGKCLGQFTDNEALYTAVSDYFSDQASAEANYGPIEEWSTYGVTSFAMLFYQKSNFNADISGWDTSTVTNMSGMFGFASDFDVDISGWDTSSVKSMDGMFAFATSFNQNLILWDISSVTDMDHMFYEAQSFNQGNLCWEVQDGGHMSEMFTNSGGENSVECFEGNFDNDSLKKAVDEYIEEQSFAEAYYGPIEEWDTSGVTSFAGLFYQKSNFNADISGWDTSSVTSMASMFYGATSFNQDVSGWDTSSVSSMYTMFFNAQSFNQGYLCWDIKDGCITGHMFESSGGINSVLCGLRIGTGTSSQVIDYENDSNRINEAVNLFQEVVFDPAQNGGKSCPSEEVNWLNWDEAIDAYFESGNMTKDQCKDFCHGVGTGDAGTGDHIQNYSCEFAFFQEGQCVLFSKLATQESVIGTKDCPGNYVDGVFLVKEYQLVTTVSTDLVPVGTIGKNFINFVEGLTETTSQQLAQIGDDGISTREQSYHCPERVSDCVYSDYQGCSCLFGCTCCGGNTGSKLDKTGDCVLKYRAEAIADNWNSNEQCGTVSTEIMYELTVNEDYLGGGMDAESFWGGTGTAPGFRETVVEILNGVHTYSGYAQYAYGEASCSAGYRKMKLMFDHKEIMVYNFPDWIDVTIYKWLPNDPTPREVAEFDYSLQGYEENFLSGTDAHRICAAGVGIGAGAAGLVAGFLPIVGTAMGIGLGVAGVAQAAFCAVA